MRVQTPETHLELGGGDITIGLKILALSSPSWLFLTRVTSTALGLVLCLANLTKAAPNCDVWRVTVPDS